jgi:hypothetical protein
MDKFIKQSKQLIASPSILRQKLHIPIHQKINNTATYNISVLKQCYIYKQNKRYYNTIYKHFYQTQHTRYVHPPHNLKYITLDIKECNPDKDILATTCIIKTERMNTYIFNGEGKYIHTISTIHL